MGASARGALAVALAAATWGSWKLWLPGGGALDPAAQGAMVLTLSALPALALARFTRPPAGLVAPDKRAWLLVGLFGLFEAANFLFYFGALAAGDSAAAAVTHYLAPVLVAVASPLLREPMGRRVPLAVPVAFAATLVLVGAGGGSAATKAAALLGAGSALFYAGNILVAKRLSRHFGAWALLGLHNAIAAPIVWSFSRTPPWAAGRQELALAVAGALLGGTLAAGLYFHGLARVPAARAAVLSYLEPASATLVAALALGEPLSPVRVAAMLVIVAAGVAVATERAPVLAPRAAT